MNAPPESGQKAGLRDYLAAQRTLLAWIRTRLALMGVGFVVARFGLFLQELQIAQRLPSQSYGCPYGSGRCSSRLACSSIFLPAGAIRTWSGDWIAEAARSRFSIQAVAIAFFLALVGALMAIYLILVRSSAISNG